MVADVQGWLDDPASNFGWLLQGNESANSTAKRFDTRESMISSNKPALSIDFTAPFTPITIQGQKFEDRNGNGTKNAVDSGLAGWTIFLDADGDGALDPGETSTVTGASGAYSFTGLGAGTYRVREVPQCGWQQTLPASGSYVVSLAGGERIEGQDFGNLRMDLPQPPVVIDVQGFTSGGAAALGQLRITYSIGCLPLPEFEFAFYASADARWDSGDAERGARFAVNDTVNAGSGDDRIGGDSGNDFVDGERPVPDPSDSFCAALLAQLGG